MQAQSFGARGAEDGGRVIVTPGRGTWVGVATSVGVAVGTSVAAKGVIVGLTVFEAVGVAVAPNVPPRGTLHPKMSHPRRKSIAPKGTKILNLLRVITSSSLLRNPLGVNEWLDLHKGNRGNGQTHQKGELHILPQVTQNGHDEPANDSCHDQESEQN